MHRIGSRRVLELATACSDPPTDAQLQCPCTFLCKFVAIAGAGQLVAMGARGGHALLLTLSCAL